MIYGRYDHRRPVWGCHRICPQSQTNQKRKHWEHPIRQVDEGKPISCRCSSTYLYKSQINWIHKPSVDLKTQKNRIPEHHHFFILTKILSNNISMSSNSSPFHQFPPPKTPFPNVPWKHLAEVTWVFPPCLAQQLGVLWPLRCWWLSPRRGQGGPCFGRGETGKFCGPQVWLEIFLGTRVCQVAVLSPVSIQTFMPACRACWGGPLCLCAFWGWQKPSKHPMMVDDFVLKDFKYFSFSIYATLCQI